MLNVKQKLFCIFCLALLTTVLYNVLTQTPAFLNFRAAFQPEKNESGIHVITNYPVMAEKPWNESQTVTDQKKLWKRQEELEETLQRNLNHPFVAAVHLMINQPLAEQRLFKLNFRNKNKLVIHHIKALPKFRDFFQYASDRLQNEVVALINMDIYLGEGFEHLNKTFLVKQNVSYILTRSGRQEKWCNMTGKKGYCETNSYGGSNDAYIFVLTQPLQERILSEFNYNMNLYGGENVLIWIFRNLMKKKCLNPCRYLKIYHNHCINVHGAVRRRININKNGGVPFSGMYE